MWRVEIGKNRLWNGLSRFWGGLACLWHFGIRNSQSTTTMTRNCDSDVIAWFWFKSDRPKKNSQTSFGVGKNPKNKIYSSFPSSIHHCVCEARERQAAIVWKKWRRMLGKRLKRRRKKKKKKRSSEKKSKVKEATTWLYGKRAAPIERKFCARSGEKWEMKETRNYFLLISSFVLFGYVCVVSFVKSP